MNPLILFVNNAGDAFLRFAGPMAWQSAALIGVLALLDWVLRKRARAAFRYALWLLLLVKLTLPPSLRSPTSAAYWLPEARQSAPFAPRIPETHGAVTQVRVFTPAPVLPVAAPGPTLRASGIVLLLWMGGVMALGLWLGRRAWFVARLVNRAQAAPAALQQLLADCHAEFHMASRAGGRRMGPSGLWPVPVAVGKHVELRLSDDVAGPAVCGLRRPVIVLPTRLAHEMSAAQLRAVLFHELAHIRRGDLWLNHAQCLLQILYWWHPMVWLGNAAIRRAREQAVDEEVMLALRGDADVYPATLLEIARRSLARPTLGLGLVGIRESAGALKARIRRLVELPLPAVATLTLRGWLLIGAVALVALPMHARDSRKPAAPARAGATDAGATNSFGVLISSASTDAVLRTRWYKVDTNSIAQLLPHSVAGLGQAFGTGEVARLKAWLAIAGVEIDPPKALIYNDRLGMLMVRATEADLDEIERFIQVLNTAPAQVLIEARFVEVIEGQEASAETSRLLGLDIAARPGTTLTTARPPNARASTIAPPTNPPIFTAILSPKEQRLLVSMLKRVNGSEVLFAPRVLTPSRRQAQIKSVEIRSIVTDLDQPHKPGEALLPITEPFELGPILDVVPTVQPDGRTISMTLLPCVREFVGYDLDAAKQLAQATGIDAAIPLPVFRTRQAVSSASVQDGQTIVIGLGTAPVTPPGGGAVVYKNLLVFVTATIVDRAGNRVHPETERP